MTTTFDHLDHITAARAEHIARTCRRAAWAYEEIRSRFGDMTSALGSRGGESKRPAPGPRAPLASGILDSLLDADAILLGWLTNLASDLDNVPAPSRRYRTGDRLASLLAGYAEELSKMDYADDATAELEEVADRLERITTPPERTPAPVDSAPRDLTPGAAAATLVPADIVTVLTAADVFVTAGHIDRWIRAGWLHAAGKNKRGRRTYRVGDVYALAMQSVAPKIPEVSTA